MHVLADVQPNSTVILIHLKQLFTKLYIRSTPTIQLRLLSDSLLAVTRQLRKL